jgi:hypothetical protein
VKPARAIIEEMIAEAEDVIARMQKFVKVAARA